MIDDAQRYRFVRDRLRICMADGRVAFDFRFGAMFLDHPAHEDEALGAAFDKAIDAAIVEFTSSAYPEAK